MANPTVADLIARARGLTHETTARFWADTEPEMISYVTSGLEQFHSDLRARLQGQVPAFDHPYWKQYAKEKTLTTTPGSSDVALPTTESERFDLFHSLVPDPYGTPLSRFELTEELALRRGLLLGAKAGPGYYAFLPNGSIRLLLAPGRDGTPQAAVNVLLRFFRGIQHHTATNETVDMRHEWTDGAVFHALMKALTAKRIAPNPYVALYREALARVPPP